VCRFFRPSGAGPFCPAGHPRLTAWAAFFCSLRSCARRARHLNHGRSCRSAGRFETTRFAVVCRFFRPSGAGPFLPGGHPRLTAWAAFFCSLGAMARLTRHLGPRSELAFCGSHFETTRFAIVMSVTAFRCLSSRKSNWSGSRGAAEECSPRRKPWVRAQIAGVSPGGAKEDVTYIGKHPVAFDFFYSGAPAFDQT
jgi:hypothetical protein